MKDKDYSLIADIGGTNARFALLEGVQTTPLKMDTLICEDYPSISDTIRAYLDSVSVSKINNAAIAVATTVTQDRLKLTNNSWSFSIEETRKELDLDSLKVINDFTALSLAIPYLQADQYHQIGGGEEVENTVKAVIGPGTGLGVSAVIPQTKNWFPLESEGGHVSYGPLNKREAEIINIIAQTKDHISAEALVSGFGLSLLYKTIAQLEGADIKLSDKLSDPKEISDHAMDNSCPIAKEALSIFCEILGSVAGNLALTMGSLGGVYVGGGIIPKILTFFESSNFRQRFDQHGRFTDYLKNIPVYVITTDYPAFSGIAESLRPEYKDLGITSYR